MSNAVVLAKPQNMTSWTPDQVGLIKRTICKGASDDELKLFMHICERTGLDPFAKQIYAIMRKHHKTGKLEMMIQTSIDGFRLVASRSEAYAGKDEGEFTYLSPDDPMPSKCKVTIYKMVQGQRCPFTATAQWNEYFPRDEKKQFMWRQFPETMLEKCAESKALRMAFPADLSRVYTEEEMEQDDTAVVSVVPQAPVVGDGIISQEYEIPYGPMAKKPISKCDPVKLREYVLEIEEKAKRLGKAIPAWGQTLIAHAEPIIAAYENANGGPGWEDES